MIKIRKYVKINQIIENGEKSVITLYLRVKSEEWRVKINFVTGIDTVHMNKNVKRVFHSKSSEAATTKSPLSNLHSQNSKVIYLFKGRKK